MLVGVHLSAVAVLTLMPTPQWLMGIAGLAVAINLCGAVHTHVLLRGKRAVRSLVWEATGNVVVRDGKGREHEGVLAPDSFAHPWAVVLNLKLRGCSRRALVLLPDSETADTLRQLRARVKAVGSD